MAIFCAQKKNGDGAKNEQHVRSLELIKEGFVLSSLEAKSLEMLQGQALRA